MVPVILQQLQHVQCSHKKRHVGNITYIWLPEPQFPTQFGAHVAKVLTCGTLLPHRWAVDLHSAPLSNVRAALVSVMTILEECRPPIVRITQSFCFESKDSAVDTLVKIELKV